MSTYSQSSVLTATGGERQLGLATALAVTPTGWVDNPVFFTGFLPRPDVAGCGILAVADVAASRYVDLRRTSSQWGSLDPVVTASGDRLRFESFSACNGVYARLDLLRDGLGSGDVGFGTTNVDINQPLRTALARIDRDEPLHLTVGPDQMRAATLSETHVERKVKLPDRWVRGLAEVPALTAAMRSAGTLTGNSVGRLLGEIPPAPSPGRNLHVLAKPGRWRLSNTPIQGSVPLPGAARLEGCRRVLRHAERLTAYAARNGCSGWVFDLPGARFTLVLSPDPFRGFSGEGTLLNLLVRSRAEDCGRLLLAELGWSTVIDPDTLMGRARLSRSEVDRGLAWLAASGRLGYDLSEGAWFHRELPINSEAVLRRNPRLTSAQKLADSGGVVHEAGSWTVRGNSAGESYRVQQDHARTDEAPMRLRCQCAWETEHSGSRGPCKHILAVVLSLADNG